jgi:hypothetical protein
MSRAFPLSIVLETVQEEASCRDKSSSRSVGSPAAESIRCAAADRQPPSEFAAPTHFRSVRHTYLFRPLGLMGNSRRISHVIPVAGSFGEVAERQPAKGPCHSQPLYGLPLRLEALEDRFLPSGTPHLLADINPGSASSNPTDYTNAQFCD